MQCAGCGADVPEQKKFCGQCGTAMARPCLACGVANPASNRFCSDCGADLRAASADVVLPARDSQPSAHLVERRQLTVLFCDLVGSTALSATLDPEDFSAIIAAYRRCITETVARFDGFVARHHGDGAVVYFGYPQAHEDDAERAVQAGLALVQAISILPTKEKLRARVGLATGLAVVGDMSDSAISEEHGILGDTPNLAARLQSLAPPGGVVISSRTRKIAGPLFEYIDLGKVEIKGLADPIPAWQVAGITAVTSRSQALESGELLPLIGRDEEMELLRRRWERSKKGDGRVVLLSGEPGIGKSRISLGLLEQLAAEDKNLIRMFCSPYHVNSALYPFIGELEQAAGFERDEPPEQKASKLGRMLSDCGIQRPEDAARLAELLSLPVADYLPDISPQQKRETLFEALLTRLRMACSQKPLLLVLEDGHWLDPTSQDFFDHLMDEVKTLPILVVITGRPEYQPPWAGLPHVTVVPLNRLDQSDVLMIVNHLTGGHAIPDPLIEQIIARTDGIPLFVEEMTKTVLEMKLDQGIQAGTQPHAAIAVPATLQASLVARLDRLALAKDIAQIGATIGREFNYDLLSAITDVPEKELQTALEQLTNSGLVYRRGDIPNATYIFKHALVQEAAYETLLRSSRQALHAKIGATLEARFPAVANLHPDLVARHFSEGVIAEKAVRYWQDAGRMAATHSANIEAASHAYRGLNELRMLPPGIERDRIELDLRVIFGPALIATRGYAAPEVAENYERARELIRGTGDGTFSQAVLTGLFVCHYNQGAHRKGLDVAHEFLHEAESSGSAVSLCVGHRMLAAEFNALGEFRTAELNAKKALGYYDAKENAGLAWRYVHDIGAAAAGHYAIATWHGGNIAKATELQQWALGHATQLNHHNTTGYVLYYSGALAAYIRRDFGKLGFYAPKLREHAVRHNLPQWIAWGEALEGPALAHAGDIEAGISKAKAGLSRCDSIKNNVMRPVFLAGMAETYLLAARYSDAIATLEIALGIAERTEERWMNAELYRLRGETVLAETGDHKAAESFFRHGFEIARAQGSRTLGVRLATSLAKVWAGNGSIEPAAEVLGSALEPFTDGGESYDVAAARTLLASLGR